MTNRIKVWDPLVRVFHWALVAGFTANAFILEDGDDLHEIVGLTVLSLVVLRILWGFIGTRHARFSEFKPDIAASARQAGAMLTRRGEPHVGHTPLGALMIYSMLALLVVIGASGYLMTTDAFWGVEWPEEVHEAAVTLAEILAVTHIAAVVFESWRTGVNLPRAMVTGYKELPDK